MIHAQVSRCLAFLVPRSTGRESSQGSLAFLGSVVNSRYGNAWMAGLHSRVPRSLMAPAHGGGFPGRLPPIRWPRIRPSSHKHNPEDSRWDRSRRGHYVLVRRGRDYWLPPGLDLRPLPSPQPRSPCPPSATCASSRPRKREADSAAGARHGASSAAKASAGVIPRRSHSSPGTRRCDGRRAGSGWRPQHPSCVPLPARCLQADDPRSVGRRAVEARWARLMSDPWVASLLPGGDAHELKIHDWQIMAMCKALEHWVERWYRRGPSQRTGHGGGVVGSLGPRGTGHPGVDSGRLSATVSPSWDTSSLTSVSDPASFSGPCSVRVSHHLT